MYSFPFFVSCWVLAAYFLIRWGVGQGEAFGMGNVLPPFPELVGFDPKGSVQGVVFVRVMGFKAFPAFLSDLKVQGFAREFSVIEGFVFIGIVVFF